MNTIKVLLADDHDLVRAGFRALLESMQGIEVVSEAADGHEALRLIGQFHPDVALIDISMPGLNGLEATSRVTKEHPRTRVLILSMYADDEYVRRAFVVGAHGYLLKKAERSELELAVRAVARGDVWLSPGVSQLVVAAYAQGSDQQQDPLQMLTPRQRETLQLIAEGNSTKQIARALGLSIKTVESHRSQLMGRLGVRDVPGLVRYAIRVGIVRP